MESGFEGREWSRGGQMSQVVTGEQKGLDDMTGAWEVMENAGSQSWGT